MSSESASSPKGTKEAAATAAKAAVDAVGPPTRVILRVIVVILSVLIILWVIFKLTGVILLLVLSIFFAYLVSPLVEFIKRPRQVGNRQLAIPIVPAIALSYLVILAVFALAIYFVLPGLGSQFPEFALQAKGYWKSLGERTTQLNEFFRFHRMPGPVVDAVNNAIPRVIERISATFSEVVAASLAYLAYIPWLILIPILAFFLLKDAESFRRSALQMLPRGRWRWRGDEFFQDINHTLAAYIRAQLTACVMVGVICTLGFTVLGLPGSLVMGLMAGVFEFVPLVGPVTIAVVASLLALLHAGILSALLILIFLGVLRVFQDYFIYPKLIGEGIHLHPLAVIFAILSGAELAGVAGIFLAIPVVAIVTVSYKHWLEHRGSEGLADLLEATTAPVTTAQSNRHPVQGTTPEQMARARPDLTTGELKLPVKE